MAAVGVIGSREILPEQRPMSSGPASEVSAVAEGHEVRGIARSALAHPPVAVLYVVERQDRGVVCRAPGAPPITADVLLWLKERGDAPSGIPEVPRDDLVMEFGGDGIGFRLATDHDSHPDNLARGYESTGRPVAR